MRPSGKKCVQEAGPHYLGMIFQLTDDCLDFEAAEDDVGKPVRSDFEKDVMTLPVIHAFRKVAGLKDKALRGGISANEMLGGRKGCGKSRLYALGGKKVLRQVYKAAGRAAGRRVQEKNPEGAA
ncbi:MAG: polyprenyl synthetase family protein [Acetivibrionales bacterium]